MKKKSSESILTLLLIYPLMTIKYHELLAYRTSRTNTKFM